MDHDAQTPYQLDCTGLFCPEPVMLLHTTVNGLENGQLLKVTATDPSTQWDIPKFCQFLGHELLRQQAEGDEWVYLIRIGSEAN